MTLTGYARGNLLPTTEYEPTRPCLKQCTLPVAPGFPDSAPAISGGWGAVLLSVATPTFPGMNESATAVDRLTDLEQEILAFERSWWKYAGAKETAVRRAFGVSSTRYYQVLNALIDRPTALVHDPMLVRRLHRLRDARKAQRVPRRLGFL